MRKFFILTLMVASLLMVSCVERRNRVILEKFVPISADDDCAVKVGGDKYYTEGVIDLAFTFDYKLGFQMTNYIPSSDGGNTDLTTAEANYFYAKWAEIDYEWDPKPQADGRKLSLDQKLWNKKTRKSVHGIVVTPDGGQAAGWIHLFEEAQAKNLLEHVDDIDWIASPLVIKMRIIGELADGTEVKTNKMNFNVVPTFGSTIQMGSVYLIPDGGFQASDDGKTSAEKAEYDAIMAQCAFSDPLLNGCFYGQDSAAVNCYAGDTEWERFIVETYGGTYIPGYAAAGVVEMVYNTLKKSADESGYYACCPGEAPEAPEEDENASNAAGAAGGE
ncbi:hypothetical protein J5681_08740 [bacterium]|nr:hypothetical protein [bacterium]